MYDKIVGMIKEINPYADITDDTDLVDEEILDSLGIVLLLQQIEEILGVHIPLENVTVDDFRHISNIVDMIVKVMGD